MRLVPRAELTEPLAVPCVKETPREARSWSCALRARDQAEAPPTVNRIIQIIQFILAIILLRFQVYKDLDGLVAPTM